MKTSKPPSQTLSNSIKFSGVDEEIDIDISIYDDQLLINVKDILKISKSYKISKTFSGGLPIAALSPLMTIGLSINFGVFTIALIS